MSVNPWAPVGAGSPAARHKNRAIGARVTLPDGENLSGEVPWVIPASSSHPTAMS